MEIVQSTTMQLTCPVGEPLDRGSRREDGQSVHHQLQAGSGAQAQLSTWPYEAPQPNCREKYSRYLGEDSRDEPLRLRLAKRAERAPGTAGGGACQPHRSARQGAGYIRVGARDYRLRECSLAMVWQNDASG